MEGRRMRHRILSGGFLGHRDLRIVAADATLVEYHSRRREFPASPFPEGFIGHLDHFPKIAGQDLTFIEVENPRELIAARRKYRRK